MEKKKLFIAILIILLLLAGTIFGLRSFNPRTKTLNPDEIYGAFINANIEFTCEILKDPSLASDQNTETAQSRVNEIYKKHKLPVDNDQKMISILKKYQNNPEVTSIIKTHTTPCLTGGEGMVY